MTERHYWLSCMKLTIYAQTDGNGTITATAPIGRKFVGQPLGNLEAWMRRLGGFEMCELGASTHPECAP